MQWWRRSERKGKGERVQNSYDDLMHEAHIDAQRFLKYSIPKGGGDSRLSKLSGMQLDALVTRNYHRVEKGFAMPTPRRPFGVRSKPALTAALTNPNLVEGALYLEETRRAMAALHAWNEDGVRVEEVAPRGVDIPTNPLDPETAATFITSRHSVRDFDQRPVDRSLIEEAVRVGAYAPSVCNRQAWRAHWFDDPEDIARLLAVHRGSAGFADRVPGLFVLTYDLRTFEGTLERNQGWIDGGLFSMSLMLALHGLGLGSVPLNWSRRNKATMNLRRLAGIPDHENVLMLLGVGHPAEGHRVARSARRPVDEVLRFGSEATH